MYVPCFPLCVILVSPEWLRIHVLAAFTRTKLEPFKGSIKSGDQYHAFHRCINDLTLSKYIDRMYQLTFYALVLTIFLSNSRVSKNSSANLSLICKNREIQVKRWPLMRYNKFIHNIGKITFISLLPLI